MDEARLISRVRDARRDRRMTQSDLATAVGVSRQTIIAVEGDNYAPSVVLALKIADALDTPISELFQLEDESKPKTNPTSVHG